MDNRFKFVGSEEIERDLSFDENIVPGRVSPGTLCEIVIAEGDEITVASVEDDFKFKTCWAELEPVSN